jgi:hypothetical protein
MGANMPTMISVSAVEIRKRLAIFAAMKARAKTNAICDQIPVTSAPSFLTPNSYDAPPPHLTSLGRVRLCFLLAMEFAFNRLSADDSCSA